MPGRKKKQRVQHLVDEGRVSDVGSPLLRLPNELLLPMLEFLDARDINRLACTCRQLSAVCSYEHIWKLQCSTSFAIPLDQLEKPPWQTWRSRWLLCASAPPSTSRPLHQLPLPLVPLEALPLPWVLPVMADGAVFAVAGNVLVKYEMTGPYEWEEAARAALTDKNTTVGRSPQPVLQELNGRLRVNFRTGNRDFWVFFDSSLSEKVCWELPCALAQDVVPMGQRCLMLSFGGVEWRWLGTDLDGSVDTADIAVTMPAPVFTPSSPALLSGHRLACFVHDRAPGEFSASTTEAMFCVRPGYVDVRVVSLETGELEQHWVPLPTRLLAGDASVTADYASDDLNDWRSRLFWVAGELLIVSVRHGFGAVDVFSLRLGARTTVETDVQLPRRAECTYLACNGLLHVGVLHPAPAGKTLALYCFNRNAELLWSANVSMPKGSSHLHMWACPDGRIVVICHVPLRNGTKLQLHVIGR